MVLKKQKVLFVSEELGPCVRYIINGVGAENQ